MKQKHLSRSAKTRRNYKILAWVCFGLAIAAVVACALIVILQYPQYQTLVAQFSGMEGVTIYPYSRILVPAFLSFGLPALAVAILGALFYRRSVLGRWKK